MEHLKLLLPRWKIKCAFKLAAVKNCLPHIEHLFILKKKKKKIVKMQLSYTVCILTTFVSREKLRFS